MVNLIKICTFLLICLCLQSCSGDELDIDVLKVQVDGNSFSTNTVIAEVNSVDLYGEKVYSLVVSGGRNFGADNVVVIVIFGLDEMPISGMYTTEGIVESFKGVSLLRGNLDQSWTSDHENGEAFLTVNSMSFESGNRVTGNFSGVLYDEYTGDEIVLTNGEFNVVIE